MNELASDRVEALTLRLADGELSAGEEQELAALLQDDGEARRLHVSLLESEWTLRRSRREVDVVATVLARLQQEREDRLVTGVADRIRRQPAPGLAKRIPAPAAARWPWRTGLLLAAGLALFIAAAGALRGRRDTSVSTSPSGETPIAHVLDRRGNVTLVTGVARRPLDMNAELRPGDVVRTDADGSVTLRYREGSLITLESETALALEVDVAMARAAAPGGVGVKEDSGAHLLVLEHGALSADLRPQTDGGALVLVTPHARTTVLEAQLRLTSSAAGSTVAVTAGSARFERLLDGGGTSTIERGQNALALAENPAAHPNGVAPMPAADPEPSAPAAALDFTFDDGVLPPVFIEGHLVQDACGPGHGGCVLGTIGPPNGRISAVALERFPALFSFQESTTISFDYQITGDTEEIELRAWNADQRLNYFFFLPKVAQGGWGHAEIRLADLYSIRKKRPMNPGDSIRNLYISAGATGSGALYVDNLKVVEPAGTGDRP